MPRLLRDRRHGLRRSTAVLATGLGLLLAPCAARARIFPEHRDIAAEAMRDLSPAERQTLDWEMVRVEFPQNPTLERDGTPYSLGPSRNIYLRFRLDARKYFGASSD